MMLKRNDCISLMNMMQEIEVNQENRVDEMKDQQRCLERECYEIQKDVSLSQISLLFRMRKGPYY